MLTVAKKYQCLDAWLLGLGSTGCWSVVTVQGADFRSDWPPGASALHGVVGVGVGRLAAGGVGAARRGVGGRRGVGVSGRSSSALRGSPVS
nr:unnamed protein product [Digitaria exilis]